MRSLLALALTVATGAPVLAQTTAPVGSLENPRKITSADLGPDIDPAKLAASRFDGIPMFATFRSFMSSVYAINGVWLYAAHDDPTLYDAEVQYTYPKFYTPTWGDVFDHVARQMKCRWSFDPKNRQFRFEPSDAGPPFGVRLADGWRQEDRGIYLWHAPARSNFGMDIYTFGRFDTAADPGLATKVRAHFAMLQFGGWPNAPREADMTTVRVGRAGTEALYIRTDTPRAGGVWRQWSFVQDEQAFVIVSAMPKTQEPELAPQVDQMVASFELKPTTRPAAPR